MVETNLVTTLNKLKAILFRDPLLLKEALFWHLFHDWAGQSDASWSYGDTKVTITTTILSALWILCISTADRLTTISENLSSFKGSLWVRKHWSVKVTQWGNANNWVFRTALWKFFQLPQLGLSCYKLIHWNMSKHRNNGNNRNNWSYCQLFSPQK